MGEYELIIVVMQAITLALVILILFRISKQFGIKTDLKLGKK